MKGLVIAHIKALIRVFGGRVNTVQMALARLSQMTLLMWLTFDTRPRCNRVQCEVCGLSCCSTHNGRFGHLK